MPEFAADWYPDPHGRAELRYWDGEAWTDHVSNAGVQGTDPLVAAGHPDGSIFNEPILVVSQKTRSGLLSAPVDRYSISDQTGRQIAFVQQVDRLETRNPIRLLGNLDQLLTTRLEVRDTAGDVLLGLAREHSQSRSTVVMTDAGGSEIGRLVEKKLSLKGGFSIESGGQVVGFIKQAGWFGGWNLRIENVKQTEIARVVKPSDELAEALFVTPDTYVVEIQQRAPESLNTLVVASAIGAELGLKVHRTRI